MILAAPKFVVLDSATLSKVSRDYWSSERPLAAKARSFINRLTDDGVHIVISLTHVFELLRHHDLTLVEDRIAFLRDLPLIAWPRPYRRIWFPAAITDVLCHELHAVVHRSARNWRDIVSDVRSDLWETATGAEMFVDDARLWSVIRIFALDQLQRQCLVASIARTDPDGISGTTIAKLEKMPLRPKEHLPRYINQFSQKMNAQILRHGDKRVPAPHVTNGFVKTTRKNVDAISKMGGGVTSNILKLFNVPPEITKPTMTVAALGELAIYASQLALISEKIEPRVTVTMKDIPSNTLPTYVFERNLRAQQQKADRVSGSDVGDGHLASLLLYADAVEVDKRTLELVARIRRGDSRLAALMGNSFRSAEYCQIPERLGKQAS